ncbi:MAG: prepilin-type N-terminal cleavage/methylation domain-containing protein [Cyanobacteriota bacterium]|nr:prepilin-type N-terminal cleavage/methylation domain-containing protein [Cyanobacteriota bacterium]
MRRQPKGARRRSPAEEGFSLVELLVALALALTLAAAVIQGLAGASRGGERLLLLLRERLVARRSLALLKSEVEVARSWRAGPTAGVGSECALAGRVPVLALETEGRQITYSIGSAPSPIWRGLVLMRCGPAYGLSGELSGGAAQNRVLIDGLTSGGFRVEPDDYGWLTLKLEQAFAHQGRQPLILKTAAVAVSPGE